MAEGSWIYQRLRTLRRSARTRFYTLLFGLAPDGDAPPPDLKAARRILLVLVNFRLGNTVMATPAVRALCDALDGRTLDFLGGPAAPALLAGFPLRTIHVVERRDLWQPWRLVRGLRELRRERYDVAIHLAEASTSLGALLTRLSGAPQRVGAAGRDRNFFFTKAVPSTAGHKVDQINAFVRALGIAATSERTLALAPGERERARAWLREHAGEGSLPIALFVGARAHKGKSWTSAAMGKLAEGLRARGFRLLVVLGPEEQSELAEIRAALGAATYAHGLPVRDVAALLSLCAAVVTPDAGPMHLAIASGAPTIALFRKGNFARWGPRPPQGEVVFDPAGGEVTAVLQAVGRLTRIG